MAPRLMLDPPLALSLALLLGQRAAVQPAPCLALFVLSLALGHRRLGAPLALLALLAFSLGAGRAAGALGAADRARLAARDALGAPRRCEARARVSSSPVKKGDALRFQADLASVVCEERPLAGTLHVRLYGGPEDLARGDELEVVVSLAPAELFFNPELPDPRPQAARSRVVASGQLIAHARLARAFGPAALIDRARASVRARIEATYPEAAAPLARALVLGEEDLEPEDDQAFRRSGLSHLLAVSGTHLVLVVLGLVRALRAALGRVEPLAARLDPGRVAAAVGVAVAFAYADFAGGSGSAIRAAVMLAASLSARALGRAGCPVRALALSIAGLALADPLVAFDISFLLSAAATAGLMRLSRPLEGALVRIAPRPLERLASPLAATLAATLACSPLLASLSPSLPLAGVAANLLAVPLGELAALPVCLLHALLSPLPAAERGAALAGSGALLLVRAIARASSAPAWAALPVPGPTELEGMLLALGAAALLVGRGALRRVTPLALPPALALAEALAAREGAPRGRLRVTALDVGQGDSLLIDLPDGRLMLIDGGGFVGSPVDPGRSVLLPTLRARRRARVDVAVLSHPHPDHFLGLASALPEIGVGELWDSGQGEAEGAGPTYAALLSGLRARAVPVLGPGALCGRPRAFGEAEVELLAPCPGPAPFVNPNDNSLVLRVRLGARAALFMGDAEGAEERALLAARGDGLRADLLKAGHHGSRTSTSPALLARVRPDLAILSTGVRNRFGHPHPLTLAALARARVPVARTDRGGAVVWETDGAQVWVRRVTGSE